MAEEDKELKVITTIVEALDSLEGEAKKRALRYVLQRLGLTLSGEIQDEFSVREEKENVPPSESLSDNEPTLDIRSLKVQKDPSSANQMATVVAYYLSEVVPKDERRNSISQKDIEKYFKQAGYPLPKAIKDTLPNAKFAGYFDSGATVGSYKLNPVGYNLVTHSLPKQGSKKARPQKRTVQKSSQGQKKRPKGK